MSRTARRIAAPSIATAIGLAVVLFTSVVSPLSASAAPESAPLAATSVITTAPVPTISGAVNVSVSLKAVPGVWAPTGITLSYQWRANGTPITGATSNRFLITTAQIGKRITVSVTGTKAGYATVTMTSAQTAAVRSVITTAPVPIISGALNVGVTLKATPGTWAPSGITLSYQWNADGVAISGATTAKLLLTDVLVGKRVSVSVTGTKTGYTTVTTTSVQTAAVRAVLITGSVPTISGSATVGSTLTAQPGTWAPNGVALSYQWSANGTAIGGAIASTYGISSVDTGKTITVTVTGAKSGLSSVTRTSASTAAIPTPAITGTAATQTQRMSDATLNSTQNGWYAQGSVLTLVCHRFGQSVQGYFSAYVGNDGWDSLWYKVSDGYFVADVDLETGTLDPEGPECAGSSPQDSTNATVMVTTQRMAGSNLNSGQSGTYGVGARLTLTCYAHGQAVQGYFSPNIPGGYDDLWYKVSDGFYVADVDIETGSNDPVTPACFVQVPPPSGNNVLARAQTWLDARVPYNQGAYYTNQYGTYRQDCSGFVSMAFGLSTSYVTGTLPTQFTRINKDDLQPGDIMLNTAPGNSGHTAIFVRWTDASHSHYVSWEENGAAGRAFEQVVPYPYWPSWEGSSNYNPYRKN